MSLWLTILIGLTCGVVANLATWYGLKKLEASQRAAHKRSKSEEADFKAIVAVLSRHPEERAEARMHAISLRIHFTARWLMAGLFLIASITLTVLEGSAPQVADRVVALSSAFMFLGAGLAFLRSARQSNRAYWRTRDALDLAMRHSKDQEAPTLHSKPSE